MKKILLFIMVVTFALSCSKDGSNTSSDSDISRGKGGSMARFAISGDVLYTVSTNTLKLFNIEDAANPGYSDQRDVQAGFDIETVFPLDTLLFIGSRSGMYVYDISDPRFPVKLSEVFHIRSCDPVVAQDNYAYVTLNTNVNSCGIGSNNVLDIYDISDPLNPELKRTVQLNGPKGLGIDGDKLFVCDNGLKVFNISDPLNIRQIDDLVDIGEVDIRASYDVIPVSGLLLLVAEEGLFQFDYTGPTLKFVSKIEIQREP
ncbi:MAG: hypothetical protein LBE56_09165 [Tannerella sp.]|nr:hypothetical protein [Tannerella sp.]